MNGAFVAVQDGHPGRPHDLGEFGWHLGEADVPSTVGIE